jgi:hypothetical protein
MEGPCGICAGSFQYGWGRGGGGRIVQADEREVVVAVYETWAGPDSRWGTGNVGTRALRVCPEIPGDHRAWNDRGAWSHGGAGTTAGPYKKQPSGPEKDRV